MNTVAKYIIATVCILIAAYGGWLVITTTLPIGEWFEKERMWRTVFNLLIIIGVVGFIAVIVEAKRK